MNPPTWRSLYERLSHLSDERLADYQRQEIEAVGGDQHRYVPLGLSVEELRGWLISRVAQIDLDEAMAEHRRLKREREHAAELREIAEREIHLHLRHDREVEENGGLACSPICSRCTDIDYETRAEV